MKTHTSDFKNNIKMLGKEIDSKITYTENNTTIELGNEQLNSITPHYEGGILKSVMRQLDIDSNVEIPLGTILTYQFGVKVGSGYEYINFGNYVVYKAEKQEDTNSWQITCYDKMLYAMKDYESLEVTYPITVRNYINALCTKLGLTFKNANSTFANYNKQITKELYLDEDGKTLGYTYRDVLDELAQVTASTICINENDDELEIRYINNTNDTIDEEYLKDVNVNFGEKYGPVNTIVLSRSAGADNIYYPSTLPSNPIEIKISDNQILNGDNRDEFIENIYNKLNGLEYYINDFSSTGITYYNLCDRYNVSIGNQTYSCVMFNDEINITQGLEENIYTEMPKESVTDYKKSDTTDRRINQTTLIVDKQQGEITALVDTTQDIQKEINPTNTASGSSIYIEDSTDAELVNFEMEGKTTQETRSGKNLFNKDASFSSTGASSTILDTGLRVNSTVAGNYKRVYTILGGSELLGKTITVSSTMTVSASNIPSIRLFFGSSSNSAIQSIGDLTSTGFSTMTIPSSFPTNATGIYVLLYSNTNGTGNIDDYVDYTNLQIELGSTATAYEPYGLMPSPDYPSELVSVGYENLINKERIILGYFRISDGTYLASTSATYKSTELIPISPSTKYYSNVVAFSSSAVGVTYWNDSGTFISGSALSSNHIYTTPSNAKYMRLSFKYADSDITDVDTLYLIKGTQAHSYIPYGKYGIEVKTIGKNILPTKSEWEFGDISSSNGQNTSSSYYIRTTNYIKINSSTNYYYSSTLTNSNSTWNIYQYDENKNYISREFKPNSYTSSNNCRYIRFAIRHNSPLSNITLDDIANDKLMLEKGNQATTYEEYKSKTYLYTLNQPLRSISNTKDLLYIRNGMLYVKRSIGSILLNGSEVGWSNQGGQAPYSLIVDNLKTINSQVMVKSSNFMGVPYSSSWTIYNALVSTSTASASVKLIKFRYVDMATLDNFKSWLSTHNTEINYILAEPYTEELGQVDMPSTYKTITHIDTTDELEPNMDITYVRDTQITNYVEEHISQIIVNEEGITQRVQTIEDSDYGGRISEVEQKQTDTDLTIDIISTNIDKTNGEVRAVTTNTGFTFDENGLNIKKSDTDYNTLIDNTGTYYKDGETIISMTNKDGFLAKDFRLQGQHYYSYNANNPSEPLASENYDFVDERIEVEVDGQTQYAYATFYNGEV